MVLLQRSVNSVGLTLERNITHDFEMAGIFKIVVFSKVRDRIYISVFSYNLLIKTALKVPVFLAKLQKTEIIG